MRVSENSRVVQPDPSIAVWAVRGGRLVRLHVEIIDA